MNQNIQLAVNGDGQVEFNIKMASYLSDVVDEVEDLLEPVDENQNSGFFDLEAIHKGLASNESISNIDLKTEGKESLELIGRFHFHSVNEIVQQAEKTGKGLIDFNRSDDISRLTVTFNRETIGSFIESNPGMDNPLVENFGPTTTEGMSGTDYLDMMEFALGEESRQGILDSNLSITITVAGKILNQKGGIKVDEKTVRFEIPLLDLLILESPLVYTIEYKEIG